MSLEDTMYPKLALELMVYLPQPGSTDAHHHTWSDYSSEERKLVNLSFYGSYFWCKIWKNRIIQDHKGFLQKIFILGYIFSSLILKNFVHLLGAMNLTKSFYTDKCWSNLLVIQDLDINIDDIKWIIPQEVETTCLTLKWHL